MTSPTTSLRVAMIGALVCCAGFSVSPLPGLRAAPLPIEAQRQELGAAQGEFLEGQVVVEGVNPIPIVELYLRTPLPEGFRGDAAQHVISVRPGADGRFRSRVPDGTHFIEASGIRLPEGYAVATLSFGSTNLTQGSIDVRLAAGAPMRLVLRDTKVLPAVRVSGHLRFQAEAPKQVTLRLTNQSQYALPLETQVRADGSFAFANVRPGGHSVEILATTGAVALRTTFYVTVTDRNIEGVELQLPSLKAVRVVTTHGWQGTQPTYYINLRPVAPHPHHLGWVLAVKPGTTSLQMPVGQFQVSGSSESGTIISSMTYGGVDVLSDWRITIRPEDAGELHVDLRLR